MTNLVEAVNNSETLKAQLLGVVQSAIDTGKDVVDFTYEQAPILVDEIIRYNMVISGMWVGISLFVLAFGLYLTLCFKRNGDKGESYDDKDGWYCVATLTAVCTAMGFLIPFLSNISTLIKTIVAPRLFLLEYIAELVK